MLGDTRDRRAAAAASAQIKTWVKKHLGFDASASIMVTELACHEPGCPPLETVIAVLESTGTRTWKIPRPAIELSTHDIEKTLRQQPASPAPGHSPTSGCCGSQTSNTPRHEEHHEHR